jgi:hypothetical protein
MRASPSIEPALPKSTDRQISQERRETDVNTPNIPTRTNLNHVALPTFTKTAISSSLLQNLKSNINSAPLSLKSNPTLTAPMKSSPTLTAPLKSVAAPLKSKKIHVPTPLPKDSSIRLKESHFSSNAHKKFTPNPLAEPYVPGLVQHACDPRSGAPITLVRKSNLVPTVLLCAGVCYCRDWTRVNGAYTCAC